MCTLPDSAGMAQDNEWWKQGATEIQPTATEAKPAQASGDWWKQGAKLVEAEPPSLARSAGDSAIALGTGVAQGVKMVSDAFGANNTVSRLMDKGIQTAEGLESDHRKAQKQERAQTIKAAEDSGSTWEEVKAYAGSFADAPIDTTLNAVGSVVPTLAAAALTGGTGAAAQLAARAAPLAIGAVQGAGAVKGSIYDSVERRHLDAGATPEQAEQRADVAQSYGGDNLGSIAAGAGLGMLAGSTGAEAAVRRLAGAGAAKQAAEASATGIAKGAALGVAKEAPMEAVQGGQERLASNLAEQGEGFDTATMRGVIGQATLEGLAAAPLGGGLGAVEASHRSGRVDPEVPGNSSDASGMAEPVATSGEGAAAGFQAQTQAPAEHANGEANASQALSPDAVVQPEAMPEGQEQAQPVAQPVVGADEQTMQPMGQAAPLSKSAAMGINPSDGTLSAAAAQAVDSGLNDQLQAVAAAQQQAQSATKQTQSAKTTEGVDADTGEVSGQAREQQILERLDYLGQQGRATGWTQEAVSQRDALQQELDLLNPGQRMDQLNSEAADADAQARDWASRNYKPNAKPLPEHAAQGGAADVGEANEQRRIKAIGEAKGRAKAARDEQLAIQEQGNAAAALAAKHDLKALRRKKTDDLSTEELQVLAADLGPRHVRAKALEKAIQTRAEQAQTAINQGAITDGTQTDQAQQGRAQPPQARATQAVQPAAQGVNNGPAQTENHGVQDSAQAATQGTSAVPAPATAQGEKRARQIARESSEARHQRLLNASESWTRMTAAERQAVAGQAKGMNVIAKRNVHTRPWADLNPKHRDALMEVMAPQAEAPSDMQAFAPETGTLGIPRAEMPQVPTQSHGGLVKHLNAQGIAHETTTVDAASLKPTQAEYSPTKVAKAKGATGDRAVIVSKDGHIIDGHHQAMAAAEDGKPVKAIVLDAPVEQALEAVKKSPSASAEAQGKALFRRSDAESSQDFDVPGFLKTMNEGRPVLSEMARARAVAQVKGTTDAIRKTWANGPEVVLAYDMADPVIPEAVRRADQNQRSGGASGEPEGFYHQGKVYLLASQLKTPNDAARVLFHESLGHHGLRGVFGKELDGILNQIATMRKADVNAKIREYGLREGNTQDRRIAAEEVLAEMAQSTPEIGFVKRAVAAIRTWLRKNVPGFQSLKLTDAEIISNYLMPARAWVETELGVSQAHEGSGIDTPSSTQAISTLSRERLVADSVATGDTVPSLDRATHRDSTKRGSPTGADDNASLVPGGPQGNVMSGGSKLTAGNEKVPGASVGGATQSSATQSNATRSRDELGADTQTILNGANDLGNMEGKQAIWSGSEPRSAVTGQQPLYAGKPEQNSGQAAPIAQADDKRVSTKESLPNHRVSRADAKASGRSGSNNSGDATNLPSSRDAGKVSALEQGKPMLSRSARKPDDFVSSPDGGLDFGEISAEMGKAMRRQAGAIRLRQGNEAWGLTHIEMRHGRDVVAMGYSDVQDFVSKVAKGFTKIYSGRGAALDVVIDNEARGMLIVSLEPAADGDFYDIKTATPIRRDQFKNEKALWERTGPSASTVKDSPPYPRSQSDEVILPLASKNDNDAPMFSRSKLADLKDKGMKLAHDALTHPGKVSLWDKTVGTMRHVSERYPAFKPVFESAQQFIDDVASVANQAAQVAPRLIPRVETVGDMVGKNRKRAISVGDNQAIGKALFGGTLDWGRDQHGKAMPMDALRAKYQGLTVDQKAEVLLAAKKIDPRMMAAYRGKKLNQFETIINQKFESTILKAGAAFNHKELKEFFNLNDQQISLYDEARATVDKSLDITARAEMLRTLGRDWDGMRDIVMDAPTLTEAWKLLDDELEHRAKQYPDTRDRLATQMQQLSTTLSKAQELMDHGYMPLQRFGKYTLDVLDQNGERLYYGMFESKADSHKMLEAMRREFPDAKITQGTMNEHKHKLMAGITPETAELFGSMLGLDAEGNQEKDKAFQEYLKLAKNNHSAMKRLIHRKGILGYSDDVGRVLASFVYSNARVSATGLNAGKMETAINDLNTKHKEEGELGEIAAKLRSYIQDPQEEGQAIRGMLFAQYLGGSLASAAVNMTQPFAVTLPWLSQYGGMAKASKYMSGALRDMVKRGNKYEADLAHALKMAEDDGVVSPQEIHQLMAQARGAGGLRTGDGTKLGDARAAASNAWEKGKVAWGQPFALAEQFNRRSTFIAAYRLARDRGMDSPAQFARDAVVETQFLYTKANKPQWARGAIGGTLFTFKTYSVSFLELMHRTWNAGESGSAERAAGRRAVGWAMLMLMLMGGAGGMPFVEDVEDLVDGAGQMMGYNLSSKQWRKDLMREVLGGELAEFMDSGLSGLPGAPIDVSGRLGMGNLIPGTGLLLNKQSNTRDMVEMLGPAGDLVARGFSGAKSVASGVINRDAASIGRGAMEVMPNAVRNAAKGADMAASGIYKDSKGYKVIDTSLDEALWKAIGFQPRSVAEVQESNSFMQRAKGFYTQTSNDIRAQWAKALFEKDEAGVRRVRERLAQWNEQNPDQTIRINMPDIWKRARQMGKDRTARIADTAPTAIRQQMREFAARE